VQLPGEHDELVYLPLGAGVILPPWNFPLAIMTGMTMAALVAGNTVVIKPSSETPVIAAKFAEVLHAAGFPPRSFALSTGSGSVIGDLLVEHPKTRFVSFTGSRDVGLRINELAAKPRRGQVWIKRVIAEMGGKDAIVVDEDADLEAAAAGIAGAGFFNAGQDCTAATRVLVHERLAADFTAALTEAARETKVGAPSDPDAYFGPVNNAGQLERVSGFLARTPDHATVQTGGEQVGDRGYFYAPTVVSGLQQHDEMIQNEIFGPVITVQTFTDEDQAVAWANGVQYGLSSSVWTKDHKRAMRMTKRLDFGAVWVNTHIPFVSEMPHGGFKHSGYGKDLSMYGLEDYTRIKHVMHYIGD
jgi:betaine-aldehyde dehydrogenase